MDEVTYRILTDMQLSQVQLIALADFEKDDAQLIQAKKNRSLVEYYFTCTPSLPLYVLAHEVDVDIITYLDADLYFFSSIAPVYREFGDGSVLIIKHRFPPALKDREIFGIYNVGMLSFRRDNNGFAVLHWWRDRCIEWCYDRVENDRFADQKYLDSWPDRFAGVVVLKHIGAGLAPWNLVNYVYSWKKGEFLIDEQPLIFYHFHGVKRINRWIWDTNIMVYKTRLPKLVKQNLYLPYLKGLTQIDIMLFKCCLSHLCEKQSIRGSTETQVLLRKKIYNIFNFTLNYFKKCVNNDLILI